MSEPLLSRAELAAIVDELAEARAEQRARRVPALDAEDDARHATARRVLENLAREQARAVASRVQHRVDGRLLSIEELRAAEAAALVLAEDRLVRFGLPGGEPGWVLVSRPLLFAWMRRAFGARDDAGAPPPVRPYTPIELRFLRRAAGEMVERLATLAGCAVVPAVGPIESGAALREQRTARLLVATFAFSGLDEVGRLRLLLPRGWLGEAAAAPRGTTMPAAGSLANAVLETPVRLSVCVGTARLTLAELAALRPGQVIPIESRRDGSVLAHVEGAARFRAMRGAVEGRLAVQILERLGDEEDDDGLAAS